MIMSQSSKYYAVKVRFKREGSKTKTFRGMVTGGSPVNAEHNAERNIYEILKEEFPELEQKDFVCTDCQLYDDFVFFE